MTEVIWKFPLAVCAWQDIEMPRGARLLHVDAQRETPCVWALVDNQAEKVKRRFLLCVTGVSPETALPTEYVGTFQLGKDSLTPFAGHLFDCGEL